MVLSVLRLRKHGTRFRLAAILLIPLSGSVRPAIVKQMYEDLMRPPAVWFLLNHTVGCVNCQWKPRLSLMSLVCRLSRWCFLRMKGEAGSRGSLVCVGGSRFRLVCLVCDESWFNSAPHETPRAVVLHITRKRTTAPQDRRMDLEFTADHVAHEGRCFPGPRGWPWS